MISHSDRWRRTVRIRWRPKKGERDREGKKFFRFMTLVSEMRCANCTPLDRKDFANFFSFDYFYCFNALCTHRYLDARWTDHKCFSGLSKEAISMIYWFLKELIKFKINRPRPQRNAATWIILRDESSSNLQFICIEWLDVACVHHSTLKCNQTEINGRWRMPAYTTRAKGFAIINVFRWFYLPFQKCMENREGEREENES